MGWSVGSEIIKSLINTLNENKVPPSSRYSIYVTMIRALWMEDWDTENECMGLDPEFDLALRTLDPESFKEEI